MGNRLSKIYTRTGDDGSTGLEETYIMVDGYCISNTAAAALMDAVKGVLDAYSGTVSGVYFNGIFLERESDIYDDQVKTFRISQIYRIWYYI